MTTLTGAIEPRGIRHFGIAYTDVERGGLW